MDWEAAEVLLDSLLGLRITFSVSSGTVQYIFLTYKLRIMSILYTILQFAHMFLKAYFFAFMLVLVFALFFVQCGSFMYCC